MGDVSYSDFTLYRVPDGKALGTSTRSTLLCVVYLAHDKDGNFAVYVRAFWHDKLDYFFECLGLSTHQSLYMHFDCLDEIYAMILSN